MKAEQDQRKSQLAVIFMTVFLFLAGFGIVIPIIPLLGKEFGGTAFQIGALTASYSLMQFLFAPFWGKWSDRVGRRPILLLCLVGEALAYVVFALARSYESLMVARLLAGFFGASISTASAYISDITPPQERSKGMALIGAAFGLGFLVGPLLGGALNLWGKSIWEVPFAGTTFTGFWVAAICLANFIFALKFLKESLPLEKRKQAPHVRPNRFAVLLGNVKKPVIGKLIFVFFLSSLAMSTMEVSLVLFMAEKFKWSEQQVLWGFGFIGLISVICQGFLVRRLLPVWGEKRMLQIGLISMALAFSGIALVPTVEFMAVVMILLALGNSFTNPSILGSISLLSSADEQGEVLGSTQGTASLGRILGPLIGGAVYQTVTISFPFLLSSFFTICGFLIVVSLLSVLPSAAQTSNER
ncbi:MAG: MFS transporter [Proteobacteria bacterium]|nr:MFS transporter [Pseudomonadota bacterium]